MAEGWAFFFLPLTPTVIEVQLYDLDWRDGSIASQLIFKTPHSFLLLSPLSQMPYFHKVFIPSSSVPQCPAVLLLLWQPSDWFIMHQSTFLPVEPSALDSAFSRRICGLHVLEGEEVISMLAGWYNHYMFRSIYIYSAIPPIGPNLVFGNDSSRDLRLSDVIQLSAEVWLGFPFGFSGSFTQIKCSYLVFSFRLYLKSSKIRKIQRRFRQLKLP